MMYLVYKAPPSDVTLGLVRDTRESNINPGPWLSLDDAVTYYYITDLEEGAAPFGHPGGPKTILWYGDRRAGLPEGPSDIPETYRYRHTPSAEASSTKHGQEENRARPATSPSQIWRSDCDQSRAAGKAVTPTLQG